MEEKLVMEENQLKETIKLLLSFMTDEQLQALEEKLQEMRLEISSGR